MNTKLKVSGMQCGKCVDKIEKFVGSIEGVSLVDVNLEDKSVFVEFENPASESQIKEAILDAGFEII